MEEEKETIIINCPIAPDRRTEKLRGCLYEVIEKMLLDETASETIYKMLRECDRSGFNEFCYHDVIRVLEKYNIEVNVIVIGEEERKLLSEIFS